MASHHCVYAGACLSCSSERRHGHRGYTQRDVHFCEAEQKINKWKKLLLVTSFWFDQTSTAAPGSPTVEVCLHQHQQDVPWKTRTCPGITASLNTPVNGFDVHLQAVSAGGPMAALLAHERLFSSMFGSFMHSQLSPSQESFRTLGTLKGRALFLWRGSNTEQKGLIGRR